MRYAILGNSGSGKSTLAASIAKEDQIPSIDLDTVYWEPDEPGVPRGLAESSELLLSALAEHADWIVEGCYEDLIAVTLRFEPTLLFLDPGLDACLENCRSRPWEPHKYASKELQDANLPMLETWVRGYYQRDGHMSYHTHKTTFDTYDGQKRRVTAREL